MSKIRPNAGRQRGVALITALLVVAIATVAAVEIVSRQHLDIRRAQNAFSRDQAYSMALGAEAGALALLKADLFMGTTVDSLNEGWAQPVLLPDVQGARLSLQLEDLQGRFNLNNLVGLPQNNPQQAANNLQYKRFRTLLENVAAENPDAIDGAQFNPDHLIFALIDWMDPDFLPAPGEAGAEDDYYLGLERPYRTSGQPLASPSELMLIKGFTPDFYRALAPYVTALPTQGQPTPINVNTAKPQVLRMLDRRIDPDAAEALAKQAAERPWDKVSGGFLAESTVSGLGIDPQGLGVNSEYFLANSAVSLGRATVPLYSVLHRGSDRSVEVMRRGRGQP
jgi:general secretion pathway protein K